MPEDFRCQSIIGKSETTQPICASNRQYRRYRFETKYDKNKIKIFYQVFDKRTSSILFFLSAEMKRWQSRLGEQFNEPSMCFFLRTCQNKAQPKLDTNIWNYAPEFRTRSLFWGWMRILRKKKILQNISNCEQILLNIMFSSPMIALQIFTQPCPQRIREGESWVHRSSW